MSTTNTELQLSASDAAKLNTLEWAKRNRRIRSGTEWKPFSISDQDRMYPFLRDIYYARGVGGPRHIVIMKPRQVGATEFAINSALYAIDVFGLNTIYSLPGQKELRSFAGARVNEIIRSSPRIRNMFSDIDNLELKVGKGASLYFRGMNSPAGLEEVPAGYVIRDEIDNMDQKNAAMILKSLGGSFQKWILDLSHPTDIDKGIHRLYLNSTQHKWKFYCPHCNEKQEPTWETNVDIENYRFICAACGKQLQKADFWNGFYEAEDPDHPVRGYHFNQLLSPTVELYEQILEWNTAQGIPYLVKLFYNTILGLPYAESSRQLTEQDVRNLMTGSAMPPAADETVMGLDVGAGLHLWVQKENELVTVELLGEWSELDNFVSRYHPKCVVIDAGPEGHTARNICKDLRDKGIDAWVCMRSDGIKGNRIIDEDTITIKVNKTEQFDEFYSRLVGMKLPHNLPQDAIDQLVAPVRTFREKPDGSKEGIWLKNISHYADAGSYAMEALKQTQLKSRIPLNVIIPSISGESRWKNKLSEY